MPGPRICSCVQYPVLELNNTSIYRATQASPGLVTVLVEVATESTREHRLLRCPSCLRFWQVSRARLWGNVEYLFKVPEPELSVWIHEPYMQPDEMVEYNKRTADYIKKNTWVETDSRCAHDCCERHAVELTIFCKQHHIERLNGGTLKMRPPGRLFGPYYYDLEEWAFRLRGCDIREEQA